MNKKSKKDLRIADLERKNLELHAQLVSVYKCAAIDIKKASRERMMGSGILIQIHYLGGKSVCPPFVLRDGLSDDLLDALEADLVKSYNLAVNGGYETA